MGSWGEQFSTGDQGDERVTFFKNNRSTCPVCQGKDIKLDSHVAGCRHNGDGYGTEVFTCQSCQWTTSFQYDEQGDSYYYEMDYLYRKEAPKREPSPIRYRKPTDKDIAEWEKMWHYHSPNLLRDTLRTSQFEEAAIEDFIDRKVKEEARAKQTQKPAELSPALITKYRRIAKLLPEADVRYNMEEEGLTKKSIKAFFDMLKKEEREKK